MKNLCFFSCQTQRSVYVCLVMTTKNKAAQALGSIKSTAKTAAARENGKKGGRPKTFLAADLSVVNFHGRRDLSVDTVAAGSRIRRVTQGLDSAGQECWTFQALLDGSWFHYRAYDRPASK